MTHDVKIDGKNYVLDTNKVHNEGDPIPFMITKKDMEYFMNVIDSAIQDYSGQWEEYNNFRDLIVMRKAFQDMIDYEIARGNWK